MRDSFFERYSTPYKYALPVITGSGIPNRFDCKAVDCPFVFFHQGKFQMLYVCFDGYGYQTALAESGDLLHWNFKALVLRREDHVGWDKVGAAGTWILKESDDIRAVPTLKKVDGRYWMVYHAYPEPGYEEGAASIGLAWCDDEALTRWHRLDKPVFTCTGGAEWEKGGLYKACILADRGKYLLFYNAKNTTYSAWAEQTGMAVSADLTHWNRDKGNPVLKVANGGWDSVFCSDPCVLRDGDRWLMFYFGFDGRHAQEGLAVSEDLRTWNKCPYPILRHGSKGELDEIHAHKPSVLTYNHTLYHFYCACRPSKAGDSSNNGGEFRCITVAASRPFGGGDLLLRGSAD